MNCILLYWLQVLLTLAIAFLAAVIAFFQWRTAHQKVVMDAFDRRMKIYTDCRGVLKIIIASPAATTDENGHDFKRASADAEFLFRDAVVNAFKNVLDEIFDLATCNAELNDAPVGEQSKDFVANRRIAIDHIRQFYDEDFRSLVKRDMRLPHALWWWRP